MSEHKNEARVFSNKVHYCAFLYGLLSLHRIKKKKNLRIKLLFNLKTQMLVILIKVKLHLNF